VLHSEKVDKYGNALEKSVPLNLCEDSPSPQKDIEELGELKEELANKNEIIEKLEQKLRTKVEELSVKNNKLKEQEEEFQIKLDETSIRDDRVQELEEELKIKDKEIQNKVDEITHRNEEVSKLKKKIEEAKFKAEKKEETLNKLLKENDALTKSIIEFEEKYKDFEFQINCLKQEKEASEQLLESLKETNKHSNKENTPGEEMVTKEFQLSEINKLQKTFNLERTELKNQLLELQSKNQKLVSENKTLSKSETETRDEHDKDLTSFEETKKEEIANLIANYEDEQKKIEVKYKREIEILHEKLYIKDNQIVELQKLISKSI
jgi:DNA repair exonuclease SbcCD ATPase subunit